jgi:predicted metalloendopeptidase
MYHYKKSGNKPDLIDGFTPEQRFFLSWGTIWRTKHRDEALRTQINTDPHSPGLYRAFGAPTNMEAFYAAFDIREGDKMYRPDSVRAKIW